MKLSRLINNSVQQTLKKLSNEPLQLKAAYKLKKILKAADEELARYEEVRQESLKKLGKKKPDGTVDTNERGEVVFEGDALKKFAEELNELLKLEVSIGTIPMSELGDHVTLTTQDLLNLDEVITEE